MLSSCAGHGLSSLPAAAVGQQFQSCHTSTHCWIMKGISSTTPGALAAHTGEGSWGSPCPKVPAAASQSLAPWTSNADPSPEAALAGPQHHHPPALGTRSEDKQDLIWRCPLLHTCHLLCSLSCARGGRSKHDPECSPLPAMQWK